MRTRLLAYLFPLLLFCSCPFLYSDILLEKPICVIVPSYNNIIWYEQCCSSIFCQNYENYRVVYIDDCSSDGTGEAVKNYVKSQNQEHRVQVWRNKERMGAMANIYNAVHNCRDHEIVVLVDGDDWLAHDEVFSQLNSIYSTQEVWFTHGCLKEYPWGHVSWCEPIKQEAIRDRTYRQYKCPSHLRTFYAWLFKKIKLKDFLYNGEFLQMAWDMAIMFPLAEMAEERHAYIEEVNYVYNMANPINDNKVDPHLQNHLDRIIRNRKPYPRIEKPPVKVYHQIR